MIKAASALILLVLLVAPLLASSTPEFDPAKLAAVPQAIERTIADQQISGAVTLIATRDRFVQLSAVGMSDIEKSTPLKPDAIFWIASMTKPVTATSILMLEEEGKLSVDDPVARYIPELGNLKTPDGRPANITLKHLLTHTSGMLLEAPREVTSRAHTLADLIPAYAKAPLRFEPGTKWEYCQAGINTLGRVIEVVSGKPLPEFFQERIFTPLGMKDTTFYPDAEQASRLAVTYRKAGDKLEPAPSPITPREHYPAANGGLYSTASDYGRFSQMLLNDGTLDGHQILRAETVKKMRTIQTGDLHTGFTPGDAWGLGVCIVRHPQGVTAMLSPGTFGHGGAFGTQAWIDPVKGVIYVLMVQRRDFGNSDDSPVRKAFQEAAAAALKD